MSAQRSPLNQIRIASPCSADWAGMYGNERKRFCGECKLNVYNLSGMTQAAAEELLQRSEGRLCVRFYRRKDGTVLTADCPVGWARIKTRTTLIATAALSAMLTMMSGLIFVATLGRLADIGRQLPVIIERPQPEVMGAIAGPQPGPSPSPIAEVERYNVGRMINKSDKQ